MRVFQQGMGIKLGSILSLLLFFSVLVFDLTHDQAQEEQEANQRVAAASQRLANQLSNTLREADLVFATLSDNPLVLRRLGGTPLPPLDLDRLQHLLNTSQEQIPYLAQIQLIGTDCHLLLNSPPNSRSARVPDEACQWLQGTGKPGTEALTTARLDTQEGEILHAARLYDGSRNLVGMALVKITPNSLQPLLAELAGDSQGEAMILDQRRHIAAFWPSSPGMLASAPFEEGKHTLRLQEDKHQIYLSRSRRDNLSRLYSMRTLDNFPLSVTVGYRRSGDRSDFAWQAISYALAWLVMALLVRWGVRRQLAHQEVHARLRASTEALYASENALRTMLEAIPEGILLVDIDSEQLQFANRRARRMLELDNQDGNWNTLDADNSVPHLQVNPLTSWLRQGRQVTAQDVEIERETQTRLWVRVSMHHLTLAGRAVCLITLSDRSDHQSLTRNLEENQRQIESLQRTDPLTQLANRGAAEQALSQELNRCLRYALPLTLACFDIDAFRAFNERYGRQAGDNVLIAVANQMRDSTRSTDICARVAGQEFMIIFTNTPQSHAYRVMERLREKMAATIFPFAEQQVTFSGGMTSWRPDDTVASITQRAETLMHQAKLDGHNHLRADNGD